MSLAVLKVNENNSKLSNTTLFKIFSFLETFSIDNLWKSRGLHSVSAYRHGLYIYRSMLAGVAQSRHAFVAGTVSTGAR